MSGGAATSGMTREEKKLVAAIERFQKLEEDSQRTKERTSKGTHEVRKRSAAAAAHETTCAPKKQRRSGGARGLPASEIANTAEQRYHADVRYRAERDGLVGAAVSKFFPAPHARSYSGTVLELSLIHI